MWRYALLCPVCGAVRLWIMASLKKTALNTGIIRGFQLPRFSPEPGPFMSRNSHTLLLFNHNEELNRQCAVLFYKLSRGNRPDARKISHQLTLEVCRIWDEEWYRHRYAARPGWIRLEFETDHGRHMPIRFLQQMFSAGLTGAVLETFHDQTCETSRCYFVQGQLVDPAHFATVLPAAASICQQALASDQTIYIEQPTTGIPLQFLNNAGEDIRRIDTEPTPRPRLVMNRDTLLPAS